MKKLKIASKLQGISEHVEQLNERIKDPFYELSLDLIHSNLDKIKEDLDKTIRKIMKDVLIDEQDSKSQANKLDESNL